MSNRLSSLPMSAGDHRTRQYAHYYGQKHPADWSARYAHVSALSSSPPRWSSPPRTPYVARHAYGYAYIRSSPEITADVAFRGYGEHVEDPHAAWDERYAREANFKHPTPAYTRVSQTPEAMSDYSYHYPPTSDFDVSEFSEDADRDAPEAEDSEHTSVAAPARSSSGAFSDSEEEGQGKDSEDDFFGYGLDGMRRTYFRTSAERGQWKNDPVPFKPAATLLPSRKSAPTLSRVSTPTSINPSRTISEPAPSTSTPETSFVQPPTTTAQPSDLSDHATTSADPAEEPMALGIIDICTSVTPGGATDGEDVDSPHTLPSLSSDRESSMDVDVDVDADVDADDELPASDAMRSSPLPPSSPPLSPLSFSASMQMSRSSSPFLFGKADEVGLEVIRASSPLSELSSDEEDEKEDDMQPLTDSAVLDALDENADDSTSKKVYSPISAPIAERSASVPVRSIRDGPESASSSTSGMPDGQQDEGASDPPSDVTIPLPGKAAESADDSACHVKIAHDQKGMVVPSADVVDDSSPSPSSSLALDPKAPVIPSSPSLSPTSPTSISAPLKGKIKNTKPVAVPKEKNGGRQSPAPSASSSSSSANKSRDDDAPSKEAKEKEKRKKESGLEGPAKKKRKVAAEKSGDAAASSSSSRPASTEDARVQKAKPAAAAKKAKANDKVAGKRKAEEEEEDIDMENQVQSDSEAASKTAQKKTKDEPSSEPQPASSSSSSPTPATAKQRTTKPRRRKRDSDEEEILSPSSEPLDPATAALHAQICGLLIETMAMSRASSMPVSALFKTVMRAQPTLKAEGGRTDKEWMKLFERVLESGDASRGGSGVFGKVESSGKDDADRPLEAQWFYVPEQDEDQERAALIRAMMPRPAKRSVTKKYKQYYWQPLAKISRWDDEDDL